MTFLSRLQSAACAFGAAALGLAALPALAQSSPFGPSAAPKTITAEIVADRTAGTPKAAYHVGIRLKHEPGWHTYWKFPGDTGYPTEIKWKLPRNWQITPLDWPLPSVQKTGHLTSFVYSGEALLPFNLDIPWGTPYGTSGRISAKVEWLACKDVCIPGEAELKFSVPVRVASEPSDAAPLFEKTKRNTPETVQTDRIKAVMEENRIRIDFTQLAGKIDKTVAFYPVERNVIDLKEPTRIEKSGGSTSLYLTAHKKFVESKETKALTGVIVADDGPLAGGWAIQTTLPVAAGEVAGIAPAAVSGTSTPVADTRITVQAGAEGTSSVSMSVKAAVAFAFLGGLILNLMPCVFPVLSLKILQLVDGSRRKGSLALHGAMFTAGVLVCMLLLSGALMVLRGVGSAVGWGFQLQSPWVVAVLALLFTSITMNLIGTFEFTAASHLADSRAARELPKTGPAGSFWTGVLAVVVASPCTAPFMGAALGYAVTQSTVTASAVFLALGLGMALPWLILTLVPVWTRWLPKPGPWMVRFKQIMAIPMAAAALWLVWVLSRQVNGYGLVAVLLAAGALAACLWAVGREQYGRGEATVLKYFGGILTLVCVGLIAAGLFDARSTASGDAEDGWQPWSPEAVSEAVNSGSPVMVDFTAAWCVTCQYNKATAIRTDKSEAVMSRLGYKRFSADWTSRDETITKTLNSFGRTGVPLYLLYNTKGKATILPELLTEDAFIKALEENAN